MQVPPRLEASEDDGEVSRWLTVCHIASCDASAKKLSVRFALFLCLSLALCQKTTAAPTLELSAIDSGGSVSAPDPNVSSIGQSAIQYPSPANANPAEGFLNGVITDVTAPSAISDLVASNPTTASIDLSWTAPGGDGTTGTAASYNLRYSTTPINSDSDFNAATAVAGAPAPLLSGSSQIFTVTNLDDHLQYYFAIKAADSSFNTSALSNVASTTTVAIELIPPSTITSLVAHTSISIQNQVTLQWVAPGDDGNVGRATEYDLRYSTSGTLHTDTAFSSATRLSAPTPANAGSLETQVVNGLALGKTYFFAIKAKDDSNNWSSIDTSTASITTLVSNGTGTLQWAYEWDTSPTITSPSPAIASGAGIYVGSGRSAEPIALFSATSTGTVIQTLTRNDGVSVAEDLGVDASGNVYALMADLSGLSIVDSIWKYDSNHNLVATWNVDDADRLAVAPSGESYVADASSTSPSVEVFSSTGSLVRSWPLASVPGGIAMSPAGDIYVQLTGELEKFTTLGELTGRFAISTAAVSRQLTADLDNNVYYVDAYGVVGSTSGAFVKLDPNGNEITRTNYNYDPSDPATSNEFDRTLRHPSDIIVVGDVLYATDNFFGRIQEYRQGSGDISPPGKARTLSASAANQHSVNLTGITGTDDSDDASGFASSYNIRWSTVPLTPGSFDSAAGMVFSTDDFCCSQIQVTGLAGSTKYYFAFKATDDSNNVSPMSNVAAASTLSNKIVINEVAPSETTNDFVEFFVAQPVNASGYKLYENETLVKTFPSTGSWTSPLPAGTYIRLDLNSSTADDTSFSSGTPVHLYSTQASLASTDDVLILGDASGLTFSGGSVQSGTIVDLVSYSNQDSTDLTSTLQGKLTSAMAQGEWHYDGTVPHQFDTVSSRRLSAGYSLGRSSTSYKSPYPSKLDWYRETTTEGAINTPLANNVAIGTATVSSISGSTVAAAGSSGTWTIAYSLSAGSVGSGKDVMLSIDIPAGWSTPNVSSGPANVVLASSSTVLDSGYSISVTTGIPGISGRIVIPIGSVFSGGTIDLVYGSTQSFSTGYAIAQSTAGTATFTVSSADQGTAVQAIANPPSLSISQSSGGFGAPAAIAADSDFRLGEVYAFPDPARDGKIPSFHVEAGLADLVDVKLFDVTGRLISESTIEGPPAIIDDGQGPQFAFEQKAPSDLPSGTYIFEITATKEGQKPLTKVSKMAVIR